MWVDLPLAFQSDREMPLPYAELPRVTNRSEAAKTALSHVPEVVRKGNIEADVNVIVAIDSAGKVVQTRSAGANCLPEYNAAAIRAAAHLAFHPAESSLPATRQTVVTFGFAGPSVSLLMPGEIPQPAPHQITSDSVPSTGSIVGPSLRNEREISRLFTSLYPSDLRERGIGGTGRVMFFVDEEGRVLRRRITSSSGICPLDLAALLISDAMRFTPARNKGKPVKAWVEMPFIFRPR
jgi:TonB family protein